MSDRRSITSPKNLGPYYHPPVSPNGTRVTPVRLPPETLRAIDDARGTTPRSEWIRNAIQNLLKETQE